MKFLVLKSLFWEAGAWKSLIFTSTYKKKDISFTKKKKFRHKKSGSGTRSGHGNKLVWIQDPKLNIKT
jgi:hypothetical protein